MVIPHEYNKSELNIQFHTDLYTLYILPIQRNIKIQVIIGND